jgi:hypothetical protein
MLDNQQDSDSERKSFQEAIGLGSLPRTSTAMPGGSTPRGLFGMSATQRLIVAFLLLVAVCGLGMMCLLITGRISAF